MSDRLVGSITLPDGIALRGRGRRELDCAKRDGFAFQRIAPGPDGPLWGLRETFEWRDEIYLSGFWVPDSCSAIRRRRSSLIVPGGLPVTEQVSGDALTVLHTVVSDWPLGFDWPLT